MKFSVIISCWNDGFHMQSTLKRLRQISTTPVEVILVDGNSDDDTVVQARDWADEVIVWPRPNCGEQFHAGAKKASGDMLLFLRADTQLPGNWQQALEHLWLSPTLGAVAAAVFSVDYGAGLSLRLASWATNSAARWWGQARGDHGLCTTAHIYRQSGGYPPIPYREDLVFCERLRSLGAIAVLPECVWPSARRMRRLGVWHCAAVHLWLEARRGMGASCEDLWRSYRGP
jgi:glycosyltransferase involved in cell wall biosynthesis